VLRFVLGAIAGIAAAIFALSFKFRGIGNDVLLPEGTPSDWRQRARRTNI
jgi:hypothetical protein